MEALKRELYNIAKEKHGNISLCHNKTFNECFTFFNKKLMFWFNLEDGNTKTESITV